jgi:hypothetical protein
VTLDGVNREASSSTSELASRGLHASITVVTDTTTAHRQSLPFVHRSHHSNHLRLHNSEALCYLKL